MSIIQAVNNTTSKLNYSIFFVFILYLNIFVALLANNYSDLVKQYLISTFAVRFKQIIIYPDQRPAISQTIQNLKEVFEKGVEKQNSLFVIKKIITHSSNQPSENILADDSLPDFTGKVLN